ncbi:MAG TPA: hypothetical protein DC000_02850, partial [Clostridiales bacterium]|nr:hypothetical protein [Clostridiales bacterium]
KFYNDLYETSRSCVNARNAVMGIENDMLKIISEADGISNVESYISDIEMRGNSLNESIALLEKNFTGDLKLISTFKEHIENSNKYKEEIYKFARSGGILGVEKILKFNYLPSLRKAANALTPVETKATEDINLAIKKADSIYLKAMITILSVFVLGITFAVLLSIMITRSIVKPMIQIEKAAADMAKGKLNTEINYESNDELGHLANNIKTTTSILSTYINNISSTLEKISRGNMQIDFNIEYIGDFAPIKKSITKIANSLSNSLYKINQSSEQVASGAEQVASGSQALSQGTLQQANAIDTLSVSINDISNKAKNNTSNAENASNFSMQVQKEVERGNRLMKQMVESMDDISVASKEISKIIRTIDDLAFQTNVLALNASVEAARAGVAGRGFAVVAGEVKVLAEKSAQSAENTTTLIENTVRAIKKGTRVADETAKSLNAIVQGSKKSTEFINEIVVSSNEQLSSIGDVIEGVERISDVIQTNSATAEESAAASEELSSLANMLKEEVAKFRLIGQKSVVIEEDYIDEENFEDNIEEINEVEDIKNIEELEEFNELEEINEIDEFDFIDNNIFNDDSDDELNKTNSEFAENN